MIFNWIRQLRYSSCAQILKIFQIMILFLVRGFSHDKLTKKVIDLPLHGNSEVGKKLTSGQYIFAGVQFDLEVDNPWLIEPPSQDVELCLHGFCWLNDLASYGNSKARNCALGWIKKWHFYNPFGKKNGWDPFISAIRCKNILRNWIFLTGVSPRDVQVVSKHLYQHYKYLKLMLPIYPAGYKKIQIAYSVFLLSSTYEISNRSQKKILTNLSMLLVDFIDTSGHIRSRNPEEFLDCFIILIEVLKVHHAQQLLLKKEFEALHNLKEIMAPILRGLRLGNGSLTRAHGGDTGSMRLIDKYLVDANVKRATAVNNVLGFERITAGRLILIVDCSKPDSSSDAVSPHASCLSFELSSGLRPIFVNCGPGGRFGTAFKRYCRSTQAHNTCSLGDISQAQFEFVSRKKKWPKEMIVNVPKNINIVRNKSLEATWLNLSHDSYEKKYGYVHYRKLLVLNSGKVFTGTDSFELKSGRKMKFEKIDNFYIYFQLHPEVELWDHPRLQTIILRLKNGEHWIFESDLGTVSIEESTFINSVIAQPQSTKRIVIKSSKLLNQTEIKWTLRRREIVNRNTRDVDPLQ